MTYQLSPRFPPTWQRFFAPAVAAPPVVVPVTLPLPVLPTSAPARPLFGNVPRWDYAAWDGSAPSFPAPAGTPHSGGTAEAGATSGQAAWDGGAASAPPPIWPLLPEPPRRALERAWLTWQMPLHMQEPAKAALRETLVWRAQHCLPLDAPETTPEYTRFGLEGEQLPPRDAPSLCQTLRAEVRQIVRVMEGTQSRTERNWRLAMHSIRLGQLCCELEQRGQDVLEEVRGGLARLEGGQTAG